MIITTYSWNNFVRTKDKIATTKNQESDGLKREFK